jgi:hypothetical protein
VRDLAEETAAATSDAFSAVVAQDGSPAGQVCGTTVEPPDAIRTNRSNSSSDGAVGRLLAMINAARRKRGGMLPLQSRVTFEGNF